MGFDALLGNERLIENISRSIGRGRISHFYLLCGPEGSGKHTLAKLLAAAIQCQGAQKPCLSCPACRKVLSDTHPDLITVDDPEKKVVPVDLIRRARADMYIRPNEGNRKIYLFPRAQDMGIPGQNALLKILEEPPEYGVFLLLTDNPEALLPTVRSRCTELRLTALPESLLRSTLSTRFPQADSQTITAAIARSGGYLGQAIDLLENGTELEAQTVTFAEAFVARDPLALQLLLVSMEKWKREQLIPLLNQWISLLHDALLCRSGIQVLSAQARAIGAQRSSRELNDAIRLLHKAIEYAQRNVSIAAICGWLCWVLR